MPSYSGHITVHDPDERVAMLYTDKMMDVTVDFVAGPGPRDASTSLTHTTDAMDRLKALAESR